MNRKFKDFYTKNKKVLAPVIIISVVVLTNTLFILWIRFLLNVTFESYLENRNSRLEGKVVPDEETSQDESNINSPLGSYENPVVIKDLVIDFLAGPKLVDKKFDLVKQWKSDGTDDDDSLKKAFQTGVVKKGNASGEDISGYTLYLLLYGKSYGDFSFVRILFKGDNDKIYYLDGNHGYLEWNGPVLGGMEQNFQDNVYSNVLIDADVFYPDFLLFEESNVDDLDVVIDDIGNKYAFFNYWYWFGDEELVKVTTIKGGDVYRLKENDTGLMYVRSKDGIYYPLIPLMPFGNRDANSLNTQILFKLNDGTQRNHVYWHYQSAFCSSIEGFPFIRISNEPISAFEKIGTLSNGDNLYQKINRHDDYLEKLYEEDYIYATMFKYNEVEDDDTTPYAYERFIKEYPVIYWKDSFGRMIELTRADFTSVGGCAKPAIYIYPEKEVNMNVKVIPNGFLTFSKPKYPQSGWNISVKPSGKITYLDKQYDYLWWESVSNGFPVPRKGWVFKTSEIDEKLTQILSDYGLNNKEISDFKEYWTPKISAERTEYVFLTFLINREVDQIASLEFSKEPNSMLRIFMLYKPLDEKIDTKSLEIERLNRKGLTVVEWGGAKM